MSDDLPFIDSLWDYNDPAATEQIFLDILPQAEKSGDVNYHIQLMTQIARTHSLRQQYDEAHNILEKAEKLLNENKNVDTARVRYLLERGRTFNSAGDKEKAVELFKQAYNLAIEKELDFYSIDAAHMLAIAEEPDKSLGWSEIAIARIEKTSDQRAKKWGGPL